MKAGHTIDEIKPRLASVRSHLALVWPSRVLECADCIDSASLWVEPGTSRAWVMRQVKKWPNIELVYENNDDEFTLTADLGFSIVIYMRATRTGPPGTDRILRVAPGQELQIRYRQPDGNVLAQTWAIR